MKKGENIDKSPVKLRSRKIKGGNKSLFLDIYFEGKRIKEYLKLYLVPEKSEAAKEANRKTLEIASAIKAERILNIQNRLEPIPHKEPEELSIPFADYMLNVINKIEPIRSKNYIRRYKSNIEWIRRYDSKTTLKGINKSWVQGYIRFLSVTKGKYGKLLNQNTIHEYLIYLANILNNAVREGLIPSNPTKELQPVDRPKKYVSRRNYLTMDEINRLIAVPDLKRYNNLRNAFLFACFCGLRYSDIQQLKWKDIISTDSGYAVSKKMQKTQSMLYLPLNKRAESFLPERTKDSALVFNLPKSMATTELYIKVWCEFAQINKHVTFHISRHTFAVNILAKGGDIYTLSKLLGHKRVTTTQVYADVLEETKKKTMELLDDEE